MSSILALDWGTSSFRLMHLADDGALMEQIHSDQGISKLDRSEMAPYLASQLGKIRSDTEHLPIIACGMLGSTIGWQEVHYLDCPLDPQSLAAQLTRVDQNGLDLHIVPGLKTISPLGQPDVMRGEETQVAGWLANANTTEQARSLICLPGTHSKWVVVEQSQIANFATVLTGELFACLVSKSILVAGPQRDDAAAFNAGLQASRQSTSLSHLLFSTRSRMLDKLHPTESCASYLSGLIIGAEVRASLQQWQGFSSVELIGNKSLTTAYSEAIGFYGVAVHVHDGDLMSARGLQQLYHLKQQALNNHASC